jgi:hypothetical protein
MAVSPFSFPNVKKGQNRDVIGFALDLHRWPNVRAEMRMLVHLSEHGEQRNGITGAAITWRELPYRFLVRCQSDR